MRYTLKLFAFISLAILVLSIGIAQAQTSGARTNPSDRSGMTNAEFQFFNLLAQARPSKRAWFSLMPPGRYADARGKSVNITAAPAVASPPSVLGNGTVGRISKWVGISPSGYSILGDSIITESNGKVGIGLTAPTSKLTVAGMIEMTLGGLKFPDGTTQTTATLQGVQGPVGPAGPQGLQGIQGAIGPAGPGGYLGLKEYRGSGTFVVPAGVTHVMVELWGAGGGGGGGGASTTVDQPGYGGGAGEPGIYTRKVIPVTSGNVLDVTLGEGGLGSTLGQDGSDGGMTKVEFAGTVLAFAGGGVGGAAGTPLTGQSCCGQSDPSAPISRSSDEPPNYDGRNYGVPPLWHCGQDAGSVPQYLAGGEGLRSWKAVRGTLMPPIPLTLGAPGGTGQFGGSSGPCGTRPPSPNPGPAQSGQPGYALISW